MEELLFRKMEELLFQKTEELLFRKMEELHLISKPQRGKVIVFLRVHPSRSWRGCSLSLLPLARYLLFQKMEVLAALPKNTESTVGQLALSRIT